MANILEADCTMLLILDRSRCNLGLKLLFKGLDTALIDEISDNEAIDTELAPQNIGDVLMRVRQLGGRRERKNAKYLDAVCLLATFVVLA